MLFIKKVIFFLFVLPSLNLNSQTKIVENIEWNGQERMNIKFMNSFIETKIGDILDSVKIERDISALTRLNGISNVNYNVSTKNIGYEITFTLIENLSLVPSASLWTTDEAAAAFRIGIYDNNLSGKNATLGGFYQYNRASSFGLFFSAPFLFSPNLGIESSFQRAASIEPIFVLDTPARYQYTITGIEVLGVYSIDYQNSMKLGINVFEEKYQYVSGDINNDVPQLLELNKILFKSNYIYDNLKYNFYLVTGFKSTFFGQYVITPNDINNNFIIAWNDFSFFKRIGKKGNWASRLRVGLSSNDDSPFAPFALDNNLNIRGVGNIVDRGTGTIVFNTEYRMTLYEKKWFVLQGNAFLDSGSWRKPGGYFGDFVDIDNIKVYPGIGLRFIHKTIFNATIRIDYGFGITPNSTNGIVFGIGQYF